VRSAQSPIGTIMPVSSASAMKRPGSNRPQTGCCQRSSASTPMTRRASGMQGSRNIATTGAVTSQLAVGAALPPRRRVSQMKLKNSAQRNSSRAATMLPERRSMGGASSMTRQQARISAAATRRSSSQ
jgi:hypothetical protein